MMLHHVSPKYIAIPQASNEGQGGSSPNLATFAVVTGESNDNNSKTNFKPMGPKKRQPFLEGWAEVQNEPAP
jgi:hypothetical protein